MALGYSSTTRTVKTLANHLSRTSGCQITERTLRRRMREAGLRWKRPRYVNRPRTRIAPRNGAIKTLPSPPPIVRRLRRIEPGAVILFEDETTLRWFPPLRGMWAFRASRPRSGSPARTPSESCSGRSTPGPGIVVLRRRPPMRQADFQEFLRWLRRRYGGRPLYLLLDKAPCHDTKGSRLWRLGWGLS